MPIVTFMPSGKRIEVPKGTPLFAAACYAGLPVASSCSEESVCGKCNMQIVSMVGSESLSLQKPAELKLLNRDHKPTTDRISCLTLVYGDCTVTTTYW